MRSVFFLLLLVATLFGVSIGAGLAWMMTGQVDRSAGVGPGPWKSQSNVGESGASPFRRAVISRTGIWALPTSEVIYYLAETDDEGVSLNASCSYELRAEGEPETRWWSINAYRDYFWIPNAIDRYSVTSSTLQREENGGYIIDASPDAREGNWLPLSDEAGQLTFLFRLYQPADHLADELESVELPSIRSVSCP